MKLLVIRPQPAADKTAQLAANAGFTPTVMPLFETHPVNWTLPKAGGFDGLLVTSANALRHAGALNAEIRALPLLAVGQTTAMAARECGFDLALTGSAGKEQLLAEARKGGFSRILWLAGKHRTAAATDEEIIADKAIVYESRRMPAPQNFAEYIENTDIAALHSPRAAQHFDALISQHGLSRSHISIAALSSNIAEAAGGGWRDVVTAKMLDDAAMLLAAQSLVK